jgi:hypothetical protein
MDKDYRGSAGFSHSATTLGAATAGSGATIEPPLLEDIANTAQFVAQVMSELRAYLDALSPTNTLSGGSGHAFFADRDIASAGAIDAAKSQLGIVRESVRQTQQAFERFRKELGA